MTVGIQPSVNAINQNVGNIALNLRNDCRAAINFQEWALSQGQSGLETLGYSAGDATALLSMASYLNTVAQVFFGGAAQTPEFDFDNAICQLYGGQ